jgi:hypothetical protein
LLQTQIISRVLGKRYLLFAPTFRVVPVNGRKSSRHALPLLLFLIEAGSFVVCLQKRIPLLTEGVDKKGRLGGGTTPQVSPQVNPQVGRLVAVVQGEMIREAIQEVIGIKNRKDFRVRYLHGPS